MGPHDCAVLTNAMHRMGGYMYWRIGRPGIVGGYNAITARLLSGREVVAGEDLRNTPK
jgi:hypothetical protein